MSRVSTANSANSRSMSTAMQLPNIPRLTSDEKSRSKYISDYEKFEPELRRHHIGTAETTNTLGLKDVPADFDRTVPSLLEPTQAEIEFARQHPNRGRSAKKTVGERPTAGTAATAANPSANVVSHFATAASATTKRTTLELNNSSPRLQQQSQSPRGSGVEERPSSVPKASMDASFPKENRELPSFLAAMPLPEATHAISAAADAAARAADATGAVGRTAESNGATVSRKTHFSADASQQTVLKKTSAGAKVPMSLPRMRSAPPLTKSTTNTTSTTAAMRKDTSLNKNANGARSSSVHRGQTTASPMTAIATPTAAKGPTSVEETARVLYVLLEPPAQYVTSLDLDLSSFDLDWMLNGAAPPGHLTTVANYSGASGSTHAPPKINSPRSVVTLLKHGVSLKDWAVNDTLDSSSFRSGNVVNARLLAELQQHRRAHLQNKRRTIREMLEKSYAELCACTPLQDLLVCYRQVRRANIHADAAVDNDDAAAQAALSTAVLQRQERQRRVFETNKVRMLRQVQQAQELQARQEAAERRQQQAEAEAEAGRHRKAAEEEMARRLQQERLEARRAEREKREEAVRAELQSRMTKAERRNAERVAARERQQRELQQEREVRAAERARRMARNTAVLEVQAAQQEQRRVEKEKKIEEIRLAREARLAEEQRLRTEKQQRVAQQRDEAKQRSAEVEEATRTAALERQAQAEARLQDFYIRRREEAAQRATAEAEHQRRLEEVRAEAYAKEAKFKTDVQDKLHKHEERYQDSRARQAADIAWRREVEREEQEDKMYAVLQLQRVAEFQKLHTVVDLLEKRKAANAVARQRDLVCEQAMRDREKLREERIALQKQLSSIAPCQTDSRV